MSAFFSSLNTYSFVRRLAAVSLFAVAGLFAGQATANEVVNPKAAPNDFVQAAADNALAAIKRDEKAKAGDARRINQLVDEYILPYVNFEKTTRLAAGRHWRQASAEQQTRLVEAFRKTLIRTYSGALKRVDDVSAIKMEPFRGDPTADDVVVRSTLSQRNGPAVAIDYRLEQTPKGWKIYDLNVENIWLIQNYRNQFAQQISQNGVDGLIDALNRSNNQ